MSDYLCEELIVEIFTRLPPKSLLRFRSLSKSLCGCISSPIFIRIHTSRSPQKVLLTHKNKNTDDKHKGQDFYTLHGEDEFPFCLGPGRGYSGITTTLPFHCAKNLKILGSCNGILCVRTEKCLILWNPSIRRKLSVPECPKRLHPIYFHSEGTGFGFDPISDDFKIVWISKAKDISYVYALKMGTWCKITSPKPKVKNVSDWSYFFSGVLHWHVRYPEKPKKIPYTGYLQTFDLSTHVFGMISMPPPTWDWMSITLTTIQGYLALVSYSWKINYDTWIRVRRDSSWFVVFKLNTHKLDIRNVLQLQPQPTNNGDLLLKTIWEGIQVYNPKTAVRTRIVDFNATSTLVNFCRCVETLDLLDMEETTYETNQL